MKRTINLKVDHQNQKGGCVVIVRIMFQVAVVLALFVASAFANPDSVIVDNGDFRISGAGNGLVFPDGSIQYQATVQGPQGETGDPGLVSLIAGNGILGTTIFGNGGTIAVNTGTSAGQIPVIGSNGKLSASIVPDAPQKIAFIKDSKPSGVYGGTCDPTKGWEQIRDLNTLSGDTSFVTLDANIFTLQAGTYIIEANAPAYLDGFHKAILVNASTSEILITGSNARSHTSAGGMEPSVIMGQVTIAASTNFVIKQRCSNLLNNLGFGAAVNFGIEEIYTQIKITKIN